MTSPISDDIGEALVVRALAALAQAQRLRAFRALVVAGPDGLTPGAMAEQLGVAPSSLSFHLKELLHANLVSSEARGRNLIYRASYPHMTHVLSYLMQHCCQGAPGPAGQTTHCEGC